MINLSTDTESSTTDASIGPPPVTLYYIINEKWLSENVYIHHRKFDSMCQAPTPRNFFFYKTLPSASNNIISTCTVFTNATINLQ